MPYFSIVMPIFNRADFLPDSISSVLSQSFKDFELICVNDGSTDESLSVITQFNKNDSRITVVNLPENRGRCIARNAGIDVARSKWVCFLDSDDIYYDNHLKTMKDLMDKNPGFNAYATDQTIESCPKKYPSDKYFKSTVVLSMRDFIKSNPISSNQFCFNKEVISTRFANERIPISEDWLFFRELALRSDIIKCNVVTTDVKEHESRSINTVDWEKFVEWNHYTGHYFAVLPHIPLRLSYQIKSFTDLLCANILLSKKSKKNSVKYFKHALKYPNTYYSVLFYKAILKYML